VVRGRASVWKNPALKRAMKEAKVAPDEAGESLRARFEANVAGAVADELEEVGSSYPADFVRRVVRRVEALGVESRRLASLGRLADLDPDAAALGSEDADVRELVLTEAARQELDRLVRKAKLSRQQAEVFERARLGWDNPRIADDTGIPVGQVADVKSKAIAKLRAVAPARPGI
jgi:hypothetical protein